MEKDEEKRGGIAVNREHKSRLFSYLFGREETKERTLSLYNSLSGTNYTDPNDITITTMEDVIYMGMKNDLSYIVMGQLSPYITLNVNEHQSTVNPNIPVREFMYAARLYDKYLKGIRANPYGSTVIPLPVPKLVVLYNGTAAVPDEEVLRLSDAFRAQIRENLIKTSKSADTVNEGGLEHSTEEGPGDSELERRTEETLSDSELECRTEETLNDSELERRTEEILREAAPDIEVTVRLVNINYGHSRKILASCRPLNEYAWFVEEVRRNMASGKELEVAVDEAIDDMPEYYELKTQILEHRAEVRGMWINEYNEEETMQMFKEEGIREGMQKGRKEGESLLAALINKLAELGRNDDIVRIANDTAFRESLYIQFGLKKPM